jgi:hypothetical protein
MLLSCAGANLRRVRTVFERVLVVVGVASAGCTPSFPAPMTAQDLARLDSGEALVAYLGQPEANPAVCDLRAGGPHLRHFDRGVATPLVEGLAEGRVGPEVWRRCADGVLDGTTPDAAAQLLDAVARGYRDLIEDGDLEKSPALQARAGALQELYIDRPPGIDAHPAELGPVIDELRRKLEARRLRSVAAGLVWELLAVVDLEHGRYGGRPVDVALLDGLARRGRDNEALLRRFANRLPSEEMRAAARRRIVRLAIAASPFREVRAHGEAVEARVMRQSTNRVSLAEQPASRASLARERIATSGVLVRQDVARQQATLVGTARGSGSRVVPELPLRGVLWVEVAGLSEPITLCQPPRMLDPSPCIAPEDVRIESPLATLDAAGSFRFVDGVSERDAAGLARAGRTVALPVSVGGHPLLSLEWPLRFERPASLILTGPDGQGPNLKVTVDHGDPARFSFTVSGDGAERRAVVEAADLLGFRIVSRGGPGAAGTPGTNGFDGTSGLDGTSASCPSSAGGDGTRGGDGGSGGPGWSGGPGGDGGNIQVEVDCGTRGCPPGDLDLLRKIVTSEGGPGGSGGPGGRGGRGGRGGSGTTCTNSNGASSSLAGGAPGMTGSDGFDGPSGRAGAPGKPGPVRFAVAPAARPRS